MKTDLVYILGSGSTWQNNEIRFSLRSVEKNLKETGTIYVIGETTGFFSDKVKHIYYPDEIGGRNADGNMTRKILRACREPELSENFLFMNDDFIINKPMVAGDIPWLHKGDMANRNEKFWKAQFYRSRLKRTFEVLRDRGLTTMQYDYHAPMLMNKNHFPEVMAQFDYAEDIGYTFRSLYGNVMKLPAEHLQHQKRILYKTYPLREIEAMAENALFMGYDDRGLSRPFKWWLAKNFPEQSSYETNDTSDIVVLLHNWNQNGKPWQPGVELFAKHYKHVNLLNMFRNGETPFLRKKLEYSLNKIINEI